MARLSWTQRLYWRYFAKPASERVLSMFVLEHPIQSVLEIGIGNGDRIKRILKMCQSASATQPIRYAGVDPFESAGEGVPHVSLKNAHRMLSEFGVKAHLIPGEPTSALTRVAHTILPSDLVIVDGRWHADEANRQAIEKWMPRLCHAGSTIFAANSVGGEFLTQPLPASAADQSMLQRAA